MAPVPAEPQPQHAAAAQVARMTSIGLGHSSPETKPSENPNILLGGSGGMEMVPSAEWPQNVKSQLRVDLEQRLVLGFTHFCKASEGQQGFGYSCIKMASNSAALHVCMRRTSK